MGNLGQSSTKKAPFISLFTIPVLAVLCKLRLSLTYFCSPIVFLLSSVNYGTCLGFTYDLLGIDVVNRLCALWELSSRRHPELIPTV